MKKILTVICALLTLTVFASCGDNNNSSISETPEVSESIVLDSVFENDYLRIAVDDDWEERTETLNKTHYIHWRWEDENSSEHIITLDITEDDSGKMSLEDFKSAYDTDSSKVYISGMSLFNYDKHNLVDIFEMNNQAYLVTGGTIKRCIFFKTDKIVGNFVYSFYNTNIEEIVMDMINSIEFKSFVKETETRPKKTIQNVTKTTTEKITKAPEPVTEPPTEKPVETQPPVIETSPIQITWHFILNLDTNCIHTDPDCRAALKILPENYSTVDIAESDLLNYNGIYWACGICSKKYTNILPKF